MSDNDQRNQTVENQTNVAGNQYNADGDITVVEGDLHIHPPPPPPPLLNLHQISEPTSDFVGREEELTTLLAAFEGTGQGAVISGLHGMGGVGKTELAHVLAKRLRKRFPDAQIVMNLRGASEDCKPATAVEALQHVVRSFDPNAQLPEDVDQLQGLYHSVLNGKQVLLLLDNARDAAQLRPLARPPDGCALIVTSRHHFALAGMEPINLDTLSPREAQKLLLEICPRIGGNADVLAKRCGCLPLALRLAASALKMCDTIKVRDYVKRLADEQDRLAALDEFRNLTDVERGIEATLTISYNLLDETLQRFWRGLSVFPSDFDAAAAGTVWQLETAKEAERVLGDLYAASMVQWEGVTDRFRLHDLARDYTRARLSDDERVRYAQHHAAHYYVFLQRTDELYVEGGDSMFQGLAMFDRESSNIRTGQTWAATHWKTDNTATILCNGYPSVGACCLRLRLRSRDRISWLAVALSAARSLKDRNAEGRHLGDLGSAYYHLGEPRKAIEFYEQRIDIAREFRDRHGEGNSLSGLGNAYTLLGEPRKAIECHKQHLDIARKISDRRGEGAAISNLGTAYADLRETREAIEFYKQALDIAREIGDHLDEGNALGNLGRGYALLGKPQKAIEYYEQRLNIVRRIGDRRGEGQTLGNVGNIYARLGQASRAIPFYEKRLDIAQEIGDRQGEGVALHNLAYELAKTGRRDDAIAHAEQAVKVYGQIESPHVVDARALLETLQNTPRRRTSALAAVLTRIGCSLE